MALFRHPELAVSVEHVGLAQPETYLWEGGSTVIHKMLGSIPNTSCYNLPSCSVYLALAKRPRVKGMIKFSSFHPTVDSAKESSVKHDKWTDCPPLGKCFILPLPSLTSCVLL